MAEIACRRNTTKRFAESIPTGGIPASHSLGPLDYFTSCIHQVAWFNNILLDDFHTQVFVVLIEPFDGILNLTRPVIEMVFPQILDQRFMI